MKLKPSPSQICNQIAKFLPPDIEVLGWYLDTEEYDGGTPENPVWLSCDEPETHFPKHIDGRGRFVAEPIDIAAFTLAADEYLQRNHIYVLIDERGLWLISKRETTKVRYEAIISALQSME